MLPYSSCAAAKSSETRGLKIVGKRRFRLRMGNALISSPVLARPVTSRENVLLFLYRIAIVSGTKVAPTLWVVALDLHIRITITHDLHLIAFFGKHCELFVLARRSFLLIVAGERLTSIDESARFGSLYVTYVSHKT